MQAKQRGQWKCRSNQVLSLYYRILSSIVRTFFIENDAEILPAHYTRKVAFTNLIHKRSILVKL